MFVLCQTKSNKRRYIFSMDKVVIMTWDDESIKISGPLFGHEKVDHLDISSLFVSPDNVCLVSYEGDAYKWLITGEMPQNFIAYPFPAKDGQMKQKNIKE